MKPDDPQIDLKFERVFCDRHGEPYRARWPRGYPLSVPLLFEAWITSEAAGKATGKNADAATIHALLDRTPLCCRIATSKLYDVYEKSGIGIEAHCEICDERGLGTPYQAMGPMGTQTIGHACFDCVLKRMKRYPGDN